MPEPCSYYFTLSVDMAEGECRLYLQFYGDDNAPVGECFRSQWTTFCYTWQDLVLWLERRFVETGGTLNHSLNRPSPFVDLT